MGTAGVVWCVPTRLRDRVDATPPKDDSYGIYQGHRQVLLLPSLLARIVC